MELLIQSLAGLSVGLLVGLVPFFLAKKRNVPKLGVIAISSCGAAGLVLGILLALPTAIAFSVFIMMKPKIVEQ